MQFLLYQQLIVTTTSEQISTSTAGANPSTSAVSHTANLSTKQLLATNTTSPRRLASKTETKSSMLDVVLEGQPEKSQSSLARTLLA